MRDFGKTHHEYGVSVSFLSLCRGSVVRTCPGEAAARASSDRPIAGQLLLGGGHNECFLCFAPQFLGWVGGKSCIPEMPGTVGRWGLVALISLSWWKFMVEGKGNSGLPMAHEMVRLHHTLP